MVRVGMKVQGERERGVKWPNGKCLKEMLVYIDTETCCVVDLSHTVSLPFLLSFMTASVT